MTTPQETSFCLTEQEAGVLKPKLMRHLLSDCNPNLVDQEAKYNFFTDLTDYLCILLLQPGKDLTSELFPFLDNYTPQLLKWLGSEINELRAGPAQSSSRFVLDNNPVWQPL